MIITMRNQLLAMAIELIDTGNVFAGVKWALYTNDVVPANNKVLTDFTITDFAGLTNLKAVTWGAPFVNDSGQGEVRGANLNWLTVTAPTENVIAYGWVEVNTAADTLLRAERFAEPYTFNRAAQLFTMTPRLLLSN